MTNKEFRQLSRSDLIEVIYEMQRNEKALRDENADLKRRLEKRQIDISEAGSLVEALAKLSGLFEAAQITADGYIDEAQRIRSQADDYLSGIKKQANQLIRVVLEERKKVLSQTAEECRKLWELAEEGKTLPEFPAPEFPEPLKSIMEGQDSG